MSTRPYETRNGGKGIIKKRDREEGGSETSNSESEETDSESEETSVNSKKEHISSKTSRKWSEEEEFRLKKSDWSPEMEFRLNMKLNPDGVINGVAKHFKGKSNKAAAVLRGLPIEYPPAPNANDFQVHAEDQLRFSEEMKEWRKDCKAYTADLLSITDFLMSKCEGLLMKKLISEFTLVVLESKAQGHIINPLVLLKSIIRHANGVNAANKREIQLRLEKELIHLKSGGQYPNETFDALIDRAKALFSRQEQVGVNMSEDDKVDIFFLAVNASRYPELVYHYEASIRKKPETDDRESVEWKIWYANYKDVYAETLDDACEKAKEYRPEVKFQTQSDLQNQFASQQKKSGGKSSSSQQKNSGGKSSSSQQNDSHQSTFEKGKPKIEPGKCILCQKPHLIVKCPWLYDMQTEVKSRENTKSSKPVSDGNKSHKTIDFAFANDEEEEEDIDDEVDERAHATVESFSKKKAPVFIDFAF